MSDWIKVEYWNGQKRYIEAEKKEAVEMAIMKGSPFRLAHSNGVDFVQPKAIALITEPSWQEYNELPRPKQIVLPEPKEIPESECVPKEISELLIKSCRVRICDKNKELADKLKAEYEQKFAEWKKSKENGKIEK